MLEPRLRGLAALLAAALLVPSLAARDRAALEAAHASLTEDASTEEGLLTLHRKDGTLYAELTPEDLGRDFLLLPSLSRGVAAGRLLGGMPWGPDDWILRFRREGEKILVVRRNHRFPAPAGTPLGDTVRLSYSDAILAALPIAGVVAEEDDGEDLEDEDTEADGDELDEEDEDDPEAPRDPGDEVDETVLVSLDPLLLSDLLGLGDRLEDALGSPFALRRSACRWTQVGAFPENLELRAELVYGGPRPAVGETIPDGRGLTLEVHYSLSALEKGDYEPRRADERVGYFLTALRDHGATDPDRGYRRYVNRWDLRKAHPELERSAVIRPVVFYMERTIPYEFRRYVREGIEAWNRAFAAAGLLDAIEVRQMSARDTWNPEDIRYNTLRWVAEAPFTATGPSRAHPLTGEILDADILYNASALRVFQARAKMFGIEDDAGDPTRCGYQDWLRSELELGALHLAEADPEVAASGELPLEFLGAAVRKTVMHEVGHVLGLRHNFASSTVVPMERLHDVAWTREHGLTGSVMDYVPVNLAKEGETQGEYFTSNLGPYDHWAIYYGYADLVDPEAPGEEEEDEEEEFEEDEEGAGDDDAETLADVASRAPEPALLFGSDEDRSLGVDPRCQAYELGHDPLAFARQRMEIVRGLWGKVLTRMVPEGGRYTLARLGVRVLLGQTYRAALVAVPYIGGRHHHRDHRGDPGARPPFVPVPAARQREALGFLIDEYFADRNHELTPDLLRRLMPDHHEYEAKPFPFHRYLAVYQGRVLDALLAEPVLRRLLEGERVVAPDEELLTLPEFLETLASGIFAELADSWKGPYGPTTPAIAGTRRTLQRGLVSRLEALVVAPLAGQRTDAGAAARAVLADVAARIRKREADADRLDAASRAHLGDLAARIRATLGAEVTARAW